MNKDKAKAAGGPDKAEVQTGFSGNAAGSLPPANSPKRMFASILAEQKKIHEPNIEADLHKAVARFNAAWKNVLATSQGIARNAKVSAAVVKTAALAEAGAGRPVGNGWIVRPV